VETDAGSPFVAGVGVPSPARNDLWTVAGEGQSLDRWQDEDAAALEGLDAASHFHELQLRDIIGALTEGRPPAVTGDDGRRAVALLAAVYEAQRTGSRVSVPAAGGEDSVRS
jgi:predicted dehydrogenase